MAGKKAFIVNRIGDFGFLLGMFTLFAAFGTLNFDQMFGLGRNQHYEQVSGQAHSSLPPCYFVGAVGKSSTNPSLRLAT